MDKFLKKRGGAPKKTPAGGKKMNRLRERVESAGEMGLARPDTPPDGIVWSAWYFDIQ